MVHIEPIEEEFDVRLAAAVLKHCAADLAGLFPPCAALQLLPGQLAVGGLAIAARIQGSERRHRRAVRPALTWAPCNRKDVNIKTYDIMLYTKIVNTCEYM